MSRWKAEVLDGDRPDVDPGLVARFNDFGELEALEPEARRKLRYVMITHANDAVGHFGLDLLDAVEQALRAAELERKRLVDAAKVEDDGGGS